MDVTPLRRELHRHPELSGHERATAARLVEFFRGLAPDEIVEGIGGHGLAIVFRGAAPGPTVLLRCELDGLPIQEQSDAAHRSVAPGVAHACGHDGHMAILAAVGAQLAEQRPAHGRVVLLFQPAEETGRGAAAVLADERFPSIKPDFAFALHNLPGVPLGRIVLGPGTAACASRGMSVTLTGRAAHAAQPETGVSPALAMSRIVQALAVLRLADDEGFATVVGARLGARAFGTAPELAEIWTTLRSEGDAGMERLVREAEEIVRNHARRSLPVTIEYDEVFPATVNAPRAVEIVKRAAGALPVETPDRPARWSEDFGRFAQVSEIALVGLGSGVDVPPLHDPRYDFPDELISIGSALWMRVLDHALGEPR